MSRTLIEQAAYNNALWCDAVCATHRGAGEFHGGLWITRLGAPRYYPDVVTLVGAQAAAAQTLAIAALVQPARGRGWAVKDSFNTLDLSDFGFAPLFDAEWICSTPEARPASQRLPWRRVVDEAALLAWEQAWSQEPATATSRLFGTRLLSEPDIHFVYAVDRGALVGGGILNRGAGVVGVSNVFAYGADLTEIWEGLAHAARSAFPGLPIVAYEQGEVEREAALRVGFAAVGKLRVWRRQATEEN